MDGRSGVRSNQKLVGVGLIEKARSEPRCEEARELTRGTLGEEHV